MIERMSVTHNLINDIEWSAKKVDVIENKIFVWACLIDLWATPSSAW